MTTSATPTDYTLDLCRRIAAFTDVPGTITRLFLSPAALALQAMLREEMHSLGLETWLDTAANLHARLACPNPAAPTFLLGSHIDTVPNAGAFDGVLGLALPLALVRSLRAPLPFHLELIAFSEEEGVRFRFPFIGSLALTGTLTPAHLALTDATGTTLASALAPYRTCRPAALTPGTFAFLECHIEQGPVLESLSLPLGIVTSIVGQTRLEITFTGQANHAGTTPMPLRRDALAAAAHFITYIEREASAISSLVATVGTLAVAPGAPNIIPGRVTLSVDIRHPDDCTRLRFRARCTAEARQLAASRSLQVRTRQTSQQASVPMDPTLVDLLTRAAAYANPAPFSVSGEAAPPSSLLMPSGAGHDAMILAPHLPSAMLFLRTPAGLSHHPDEAVLPEDIAAALQTLTHLLQLLPPTPNPIQPPSNT